MTTLHVEAVPVVSYAMAHNAIPVVTSLELACGDDVGKVSGVIEAWISDSDGLAGPGSSRSTCGPAAIALSEVSLRLDPQRISQVVEPRPGTITVQAAVGAGCSTGSSCRCGCCRAALAQRAARSTGSWRRRPARGLPSSCLAPRHQVGLRVGSTTPLNAPTEAPPRRQR